MAFSKFNICSPCCSGGCNVDYRATLCVLNSGNPSIQYASDQSFPSYIGISDTDIYSYVVRCSSVYPTQVGLDPTVCHCSGLYEAPTSGDRFYPFDDTWSSGNKHTFNYNPPDGNSYYVLVTDSDNNKITKVTTLLYYLAINEELNTESCAPACGGSDTHSLSPTEWEPGYPCWWKTDRTSNRYNGLWDITQLQSTRSEGEGVFLTWIQDFSVVIGCTGPFVLSTETSGTCGPGIPTNIYFMMPVKPNTFDYEINNDLNVPILGDITISDIFLEFSRYTFIPSGTPTPNSIGSPVTDTDVTSVDYEYKCFGQPSLSCSNLSISVNIVNSCDQIPSPTGYASYVGGLFVGPNSLPDAQSFIGSLPNSIPGNSATHLGISEGGSVFRTNGQPGVEIDSYSCPGNVKMRAAYTTGYLYMTVTQ